MNDWDIKLERYRNENESVKFGETVFAGSSLMEMFPINKLLREHNDDTIIYNRGIGGYLTDNLLENLPNCLYFLLHILLLVFLS